jgi:perosamine synthetase
MKYPIYRPEITNKEKEYVMDCLTSTWISSKGKYINIFENLLTEYTGSNYAITVFNGTIALHLAMLTLRIKSGDEVIVPDFSYIASANCVKYVGATPILVDVDKKTWNITLDHIEEKITKKTKAIIPVDIFGNPVDIDPIRKIAQENNLFIIEDAAEAIGATINGKMAGTLADIGTYSFFGNKTITTGEGGAILTNNKEHYKRASKIKNQGNSDTLRYFHDTLGYNFRMTNIQAALGSAQIERITEIILKKKKINQWYNQYLNKDHVTYQEITLNSQSSYWLVSILLEDEEKREDLAKFLDNQGIETRPFFKPIHEMPHYSIKGDFENTNELSKRGISLPSYHTLEKNDVRLISEKINDNLG